MSVSESIDLKRYIRDVPDFPKPGILFKDITPLLQHPAAFEATIDRIVERYRDVPLDAIVAAEARGFIFAAPVALRLGVGFVPIRKPGKLPYERHSFDYQLEYGTDRLEMIAFQLVSGGCESRTGTEFSWSMTCWRPAERSERAVSCWSDAERSWQAVRLSSSWDFCRDAASSSLMRSLV